MSEIISLYNSIPSGISAIILTLLGGLLLNTIPKGMQALIRSAVRGSTAVAVAEIQERSDIRLGSANELTKVWSRMDKLEQEVEELRTSRVLLLEENRVLREENRGLRYLIAQMLTNINELRRNAGMTTLTDKDFILPN